MKGIKFVLFDWSGTLGKGGQREIFIKANRKKSLSTLQTDTIQTLSELKRRGIRMGILSNTKHTRAGMHKGLVRTNLKKYFDFEVYSSDDNVECSKPCAAIFDTAWKAIRQQFGGSNIRKKQVLYVGDNYYSDVMGAQNFGYKAAYITNENPLRWYLAELFGGQDILISKLSDLEGSRVESP